MSKRMNKERAIEILKTIKHNSTMQTDYTIDNIDQALDIAIESLEADINYNAKIDWERTKIENREKEIKRLKKKIEDLESFKK